MAVIALGVAAGFAASRFLKASSRQRYEGRAYGTPSNGTPSNGAQARRRPGHADGADARRRRSAPIREYGA